MKSSDANAMVVAKTFSLGVSLLFIAGLVATPAYALDEKVLPGSICEPTMEPYAPLVAKFGGSLMNIKLEGSGGLEVASLSCPLVRDNPTRKWEYLWVHVYDDSPTRSVTCSASSYRLIR